MKNFGIKMKVALVQYSPVWENPEENIIKLNSLLKGIEKVDLIIFPEMTLTGFTMNSSKFGEEIDGLCTQYFMNLSAKLKTDIFCGVIEKEKAKYYNTLIHFDSMGLLKAKYRKIHPFGFAREDEFYSAGDELVITEINHIRFGLSVCYDLRFPELYRLYTKKGIDVIINIANWPVKRIEHYTSLLKARAIENQCFAIGVNRVGNDTGFEYSGFSSIYDPLGKEIFCKGNEEGVFISEINIDNVAKTRSALPFLKDMKLI